MRPQLLEEVGDVQKFDAIDGAVETVERHEDASAVRVLVAKGLQPFQMLRQSLFCGFYLHRYLRIP